MSIRRFSNENFSDKKHKVASNLVSTETIIQNSFDITQSVNQSNQFGADGSQLLNLPARVHPGEQLLKQAVWWIDSAHSSSDGQEIQNLGWGGNALNAQLGSAPGDDSNDPKYLDWEGENYVYLPGVSGNYLSVPDEAALDITGDIDIRVQVALDDWTPSTTVLAAKLQTTSTRSYVFFLHTDGTLRLYWTTDGTSGTAIERQSTTTVNIPNGTTKWLRATLDVDNGASGNDVKFYTSDDGVSWSQFGSTVTTAGTTSIYSGSSEISLGAHSNGNTGPLAGTYYRAQILDGIDGTTVLDVDTSLVDSGSDTSFTALTGQTVTINRRNSDRKSVCVTHPLWLFGTDDYMEVADNDLLDFGASDSFTVLAVVRQWATPDNGKPWISKRNSSIDYQGYVLRPNGTSIQVSGGVDDGPTAVNDTGTSAFASGTLATAAVIVDQSNNLLKTASNATISSGSSITSIGDLSNNVALRVGAEAGSLTTYQDFEFIAAAVFRRALTAGEIATLTNYFQGRVG